MMIDVMDYMSIANGGCVITLNGWSGYMESV